MRIAVTYWLRCAAKLPPPLRIMRWVPGGVLLDEHGHIVVERHTEFRRSTLGVVLGRDGNLATQDGALAFGRPSTLSLIHGDDHVFSTS